MNLLLIKMFASITISSGDKEFESIFGHISDGMSTTNQIVVGNR